jgi:tRNA G37 N-methylase Trm5
LDFLYFLFEKLDNLPEKTKIYIEIESIKNPKIYTYYFTIFYDKFDWILYNSKEETYRFDNIQKKGYLLNFFEGRNFDELNKYDEIYMPLPKDAELFLDCAFKVANKNAIIHMYDFVHENDYPNQTEDSVKKIAKKHNKQIQIIETRKVGQYSPRKYRVCCDFKIKN